MSRWLMGGLVVALGSAARPGLANEPVAVSGPPAPVAIAVGQPVRSSIVTLGRPRVLREGAGLGMHTVVWCDTHNNLTRCLDRQALREFEMRVLFQMSATDSSTLIDNPLAGA